MGRQRYWPVDTGVMIRAHEVVNIGFQVLFDHRPKGGIGGVFGNNVGNFLAARFTVDGDKEPGFRVGHATTACLAGLSRQSPR